MFLEIEEKTNSTETLFLSPTIKAIAAPRIKIN